MNNGYEKMKQRAAAEKDSTLLMAFSLIDLNENSTFEETLTYSVITSELENRGLIKFNDETWEYEIVA